MVDYQAILRRCEATIRPMVNEFDNVKNELKEIARFCYPIGKRGLHREVDDMGHRAESEKADEILNTSPIEAVRKGAAGFLVNLMNPAQRWVHLEPNTLSEAGSSDDSGEIAGGAGSRSEALEYLERIVMESMAKSGSYRAFKKMFEHLLVYGFACVIVKEDPKFICKAQCLRVGTYSFGVDEDGRVNRVERRFSMSAEELVRTFGGGSRGRSVLPDDVIQAWKRGVTDNSGNFVVENLIEPNEKTFACGSDEVLDYGIPKSCKYRSVYWLKGRNGVRNETYGVLAVKGFKFNPIVAPRLDAELGDIYGRGRGHDALNSSRGLQAAMMDTLEIISNKAEPPVIAANELRDEGLNLGRGGVTYANVGEQRGQLVYPILPNPPSSNESIEIMQKFELQIRACFFNDEFLTIDSLKNVVAGDKRTAAEINALKSENLLQLGGIVLMLDDEAIDPIVNTFTAYALQSRMWKEYGESVNLGDVQPKYISNLHIAQRTQEINSTESSVMFAIQLAGSQDPRAAALLDLFDFDRIVRRRHKLIGGSELDVLSEDAVKKIRDERAAQQQAMQQAEVQAHQAEMQLQQAKAAAQLGRANKSEVDAHMLGGNFAAQMGGY